MTAFAATLDTLFADPNLATDAVCTPAGGDPVTVRVIARRADDIVGIGDTRIHAATTMFDIRTSEVAAPTVGDTIEVDGTVHVIQGEPIRDRERLVCRVEARAQ